MCAFDADRILPSFHQWREPPRNPRARIHTEIYALIVQVSNVQHVSDSRQIHARIGFDLVPRVRDLIELEFGNLGSVLLLVCCGGEDPQEPSRRRFTYDEVVILGVRHVGRPIIWDIVKGVKESPGENVIDSNDMMWLTCDDASTVAGEVNISRDVL